MPGAGTVRRRRPARRSHRVVAAVAVKQGELRREARQGFLTGQVVEETPGDQQLAGDPVVPVGITTLALAVIGIHSEMGRLELDEGIQLEFQRRVAGAEQAVIDTAASVDGVAVGAYPGTNLRVFEASQAGDEVVGMGATGDVRAQPLLGAAVTGLAADAVAELEATAAAGLGHVVAVAGQALRRTGGRGQAEIPGDALAGIRLQQAVGV